MFIKKKTIRGHIYNYLCKSVRVTENGKTRIKQVHLAYLGKFERVEDAWMNASGKRKAKLAKYRDPQDVNNEAQQSRAEDMAEREYRRKLKEKIRREVIKELYPKLAKKYRTALDLG